MKSHMLIKACLLAATCLLLPPQPAIGDDFVPLRIVPKVKIEFGRMEVTLDVTKIGSMQAAANQKLDVRIQELGNLPDTYEHVGGIPVVADYDENTAPVLLRTWVNTNQAGNAHITLNLPEGRYMLKITYEGQENTNWRPMVIPLSSSGYNTQCDGDFKLNPKDGRYIYRNDETIILKPSVSLSGCSLSNILGNNLGKIEDYKLSFFDGSKQEEFKITKDNKSISYKSEQKGTFEVDVALLFSLPTTEQSNGNMLVNRSSSNTIEISSLTTSRSDLLKILYYFDGDFVEPTPTIVKKFTSVEITYPISEDAKNANFTDPRVDFLSHLKDLTLKYCDESGEQCHLASTTISYSYKDNLTFKIPERISGTIYPTICLDTEICDQSLPPVTIASDAPILYGGAAAILVLITGVIVIRKMKRRAAIPQPPNDNDLNDPLVCKKYIRKCYDIVAKKRVNATVDWEYDTIESFYRRVASDLKTKDTAFEKYSFAMNMMLDNSSFTRDDLIKARNQSLQMLK